MVLFRKYCREIIKELDKIPVYLPGTPVLPGDIIRFGDSEALGRPIGSFVHYSNLSELGISFDLLNDNYPDPYLFSSKKSVEVRFTASANATTNITGKLDVSFSRQGATYLAAIDCSLSSIKDLMDVETQLKLTKPNLKCGNCYIVTSVTIAKKALIMQSNSKNASLSLDGNVQGLQPGSGVKVDASFNVNINSYKDSSFIKPWSDNVTVFFSLAQLRKSDDANSEMITRSLLPRQDIKKDIFLINIDPKELLKDWPN